MNQPLVSPFRPASRWVPMDSLVDPEEDVRRPPWGELGRAFTIGLVASLGKLVIQGLNRFEVENKPRFLDAVAHRPPGSGLVTVCNHTR